MLAVYNSVAFSVSAGVEVAAGAEIEVRNMDNGALANIYQDEEGLIPQAQGAGQFTADADGRFAFYAYGRLRGYEITVTNGAESHTLDNIAIGSAGQVDATEFSQALLLAEDEAEAAAVLSSPLIERGTDTILGVEHWGATVRATADDTQFFEDCSTLGDGWWCVLEINSGVSLVLSPNSPDSIDDESDITVDGPARLHISCDGLNLRTDRNYGLRLIKRTIYTSGSGTHVYDPRTRARRARIVGGGGGGGGVDGQGASTAACAGGGQSGGYVEDLELDVPGNIGVSEAYSVGANGAGGSAGNNPGTAGGTTTLGTLSAGGGGAGQGLTATSGTIQGVAGTGGGVASGGDVNITGQITTSGRTSSGSPMTAGCGGSNPLGSGGGQVLTAADGTDGSGYGAGGAGAIANGAATNQAGGDGTAGVIIIEEFA